MEQPNLKHQALDAVVALYKDKQITNPGEYNKKVEELLLIIYKFLQNGEIK